MSGLTKLIPAALITARCPASCRERGDGVGVADENDPGRMALADDRPAAVEARFLARDQPAGTGRVLPS